MKSNDNRNKLEGKLVESIKIEELAKLAEQYANIDIGSVLDEKTFIGIPVISNIAGVIKTGFNIRDRLYIKKIAYFLAQVGQTSQKQRDEFVGKYCDDVKRFEETIMLILEQADRIEKSTLIGKIFKACILGVIEYEGALTLSTMVNRAFWNDLVAMLNQCENPYQQQRLFISGLFENDDDISGWKELGKFKVKRNKYAHALDKINLENYDQVKNIKN